LEAQGLLASQIEGVDDSILLKPFTFCYYSISEQHQLGSEKRGSMSERRALDYWHAILHKVLQASNRTGEHP